MSRTSVYRFAVSLSFLSRDNDTDLRQLSRNRGFKWLNNAAEKRHQPSGQRALDTLTAYITVNVAIDAIDAGKRLKGNELTGFKQKHVILSKYRRVEQNQDEKKFT